MSTDFKNKKINPELLQKNLDTDFKENPFYDKTIVITGDFEIKRSVIADKLYELGADINTAISKKTNYVLMGQNAGPAKTIKINELITSGVDIKILSETHLYSIMSNHFEDIEK